MKNSKYLYWITFVAVNGGLLFGLNMGDIAGATDMIRGEFNLSDSGLGIVASILTIGCLLGALFTGSLADQYGRKKIMIGTALLYTISALGCAVSSAVLPLNLFRFLSGIAVGATSVVGPMYISEISPAHKRGMLVSLNQFAITIGILLAYVFDYFLFGFGSESWRYMLAIPALFGLVYLILLLTSFPESPRWLLANGKRREAVSILQKIGGDDFVKKDLPEIENSLQAEKSGENVSFAEIFRGKNGKIVFIGTLIAAFQQITGINAVIMFSPDMFKAAGIESDVALANSMLVGLVNFLMTIVALRLVDSKGRKTLLLWGAVGMSLSLAYLTFEFSNESQNPWGVLIALLVYISFFAASFAPVMWVIISEIYPNRIKGRAMSFSTAVSWLCTFLTIQFTPIISGSMGMQWVFGFFLIFSIAAFVFVKIWIPETKGKSLERIQKEMNI